MGQSELSAELPTEQAFAARAARFARELRAARVARLVIGLCGDLGSGKTTWVRAMLRGLGVRGRVPSPTYTLIEQYDCDGLAVVHLDLYRLSGDEDLEQLGLRDFLAEPERWLAVEWPERAPQLAARCDLTLAFAIAGGDGRRVSATAHTPAGTEALKALSSAAV
jgi:tRNA threonylcarbamoyladenosine biosynthesis protein TsaE